MCGLFVRMRMTQLAVFLLFGLVSCGPSLEEDLQVCANVSCTAGQCISEGGQPRCVCGAWEQALGLSCEIGAVFSEDDGNNSRSEASPITAGQSVEASIGLRPSPIYDLDFYKFTAEAGHIYRLTCDTGTLERCSLELRNEKNQLLGLWADAELPRRIDTGGTIFVQVGASTRGSAGTYTLRLEDLGLDDHGDTQQTATARTPSAESFPGRLDFPGDTDVFSFPVTTGRIYRFSCTLGATQTSLEWSIVVKNASGAVVAQKASNLTSMEERVGAFSTGTAYAQVSARSLMEAYTCQLEDVGQDDHGNTVEQATVLAPSASETLGRIDFSADVDFFSFTVTAGRIYRFNCKKATDSSCVPHVSTESDQSIGSPGLQGMVTFKAPTSGRYSSRVSSSTSPVGATYTVRLEDLGVDDHGSTRDTPTLLTPGALSGQLLPRGDQDFFTFDAIAGNLYAVTCKGNTSQQNCIASISQGNPPTLLLSYAPGGRTLIDVVKSGPVAFFVYDYQPVSFEDYELIFEDLGPDDHGDDALSATSGQVGVTLTGAIDPETDRDWFSFQLEGNRKYVVPTSWMVGLSVFAPDGTKVAKNWSSTASQYDFTTAGEGTYSLEVKSYSSTARKFSYQLTVQ